jgi:multiple sugar transport system permease protein
MSTVIAVEEVRPGASKRARSEARTGALLVLPTVVVIVVVIVIPVVMALRDSLFGVAGLDESGFYSETAPFVGLDNYKDIFTGDESARFWNAVGNTTLFGFVTVFFETILGMAMALIMNRAMRGRGLVRAAILIPWAVPTAVSAVLWKWIFDANGVANTLLGTQVLWSTGNWSAKLAIIIADVWKTAPFIGLLTLAGLQVISNDVYEAAKIDGAGVWQRFVRITLPLVKPALVVAVLFRVLDALRMYDLPYILIGPRKASVETWSMLVQDEASNVRYGSASAYAMMLFLYIFIIAFAFIKILGADVIGDGDRPRRTKVRVGRRNRHRDPVGTPTDPARVVSTAGGRPVAEKGETR